ncbi:MAG: 50S ribosomal protein L31 [Patescibacteria group bacterium]|nr:50S ribosomal protein L31 [Patescibacteria group bacterium]
MKKDIHPKYDKCVVKCVCGNSFETRSTLSEINVEVCGVCHPAYTGKQKIVDSTGRVDRFKKMFDQKKKNIVSKKEKRALKSQKKADEKSKIKDNEKIKDTKEAKNEKKTDKK